MKKKIGIILLGGTIACVVTENGMEVTSLAEFCRHFKELEEYEILVDEFKQLVGLEIKMEEIVEIAEEVKRLIREEEVDGVVVVQGTNVMEEVAFALDMLVRTEVPVVCTGAMRPATAPSADGANNLIDAVCTAASDNCWGLGTLVVMNGQIHSAQYVKKVHTLNTDAFRSEFLLGYVAEHVPSLRCVPVKRNLPEFHICRDIAKVFLYVTAVADDGVILDHVLEDGYEGLVIEGTGGGGLPGKIGAKLLALNEKVPCVLASRAGNGDIIFSTYGHSFQETVQEQGGCLSNILDSRKARVLLILAISSRLGREEISDCFREFSKNKSLYNMS